MIRDVLEFRAARNKNLAGPLPDFLLFRNGRPVHCAGFLFLFSMAKPPTILLVDRETDFLDWAQNQLKSPTSRVLLETSADAAYKTFCMEEPELVLAEMNLHPFSGLELLARVRKHSPNAMVIITSAFGTTQSVIEAMKMGAFDFVRKEQLPFNLKVVVDSALKAAAELRSASAFKPQLTVEQHREDMVGRSEAMQQVFKMIGRVSGSEAAVMVTGESGSGKELVARAIHNYSARSNKNFLAINCAAIPDNLLESELFGHEKGAFTGAHSQRIGRFEQSDGGTLFLDEIGEMPLQVQSKILRVLQEGEFSRVGGNQTLRTDVRIICATNKNLEDEVAKRRFREDLFYRLNVVRIHLPPLRQRVEDITLLAEYFLQKIANQKHRPPLKLSEDAIRVLETYPWPGNVRELENTMQRASVLATADVLLPKDIPLGQSGSEADGSPVTPERAVDTLLDLPGDEPLLPRVERALIMRALERTQSDQIAAAKWLGISKAALRKHLGSEAGAA
ncbi:MAG: sigma-54 dependent transcriptional regulator [Terrimicrobiaceae bacterium]|nr:sigma-54 dependent transcriptional regulator [Terrimicrobiaceae bacterium]